MITAQGYSKDTSIQPDAVVVTFGEEMMASKPGGKVSFLTYFESVMSQEGGLWLHKCKNKPQYDIAHVYVIVSGKLKYKCLFGGHEDGPEEIFNADGSSEWIMWPRLLLAGPIEKAPFERVLKGFQGFRYATTLF